MERPKSVAKWGAACAPCAAAKAKCLRSSDSSGSKCDRCERLFKDCVNQVHKPRKKRVTKPSRTAQLEQRLNGLVDLLRASGELHGVDPGNISPQDLRETVDKVSCIVQDIDLDIAVSSASQSRSLPVDDTSEESDGEEDDGTPFDDGTINVPKHYNWFAPPKCICRAEAGPAPGPTETDETILLVYQTHLSPLFPFVIIPPGTSTEELQSSRPFLFSAIRMITTLTSMRSMRAQLYKLIEQISDRALIRSEKSLDMLQGIIVIIGWHHYHCMMHSQMNNLIHLAQSLVADLGLNRHPQVQERTSLMVLYPDVPPARSNEERRALLAVWYLSSCVSVGFGKTESLKYSPYVQRCLRELQDAREYETDIILAHMVRIQNLTEKITDMNASPDDTDDMPIPKAPASAYVATFQAELDKIQGSISKSLKNNKYLMVYLHTTTLRLYEPPVINSEMLRKVHKDLTSLSNDTPVALDLFYRASHALQSWYSHWFTVPISSYFYLPMPVCVQIIYSVTMMARWAKIASPLPRGLAPSLGNTEDIADPSAGNQQGRATVPIQSTLRPSLQGAGRMVMGLAPPPDFDDTPNGNQGFSSASSSASPSGTTGTTTSTGASPESLVQPLSEIRFRETTDPSIPIIVAALNSQLNSQPGLKIDVTSILSQFASRCAQANQDMLQASGGEADRNIWDLASKKINITRAKLERWAEIVSMGGSMYNPPPMPGDAHAAVTRHGYEHAVENCIPCRVPLEESARVVVQDRGRNPSTGTQADEQYQASQQQAAFANATGTDGVDLSGMAGFGNMAFDPNLSNSCGDFWFSNSLGDNVDPSLWDTNMMDWGPINIF